MMRLASLGQISNILCTVRLVALEAIPCRYELAALQAAFHKVHVPSLMEHVVVSTRALEHHSPTTELLECLLNLLETESLLAIRLNASL